MGEQLGIAPNTYGLWEKGKGLTQEGVEQIANVHKVTAEELMDPEPVTLNMTNNHGNNGYVQIENQQQHTVPIELFERVMKQNEEHATTLEQLTKRLMDLMEVVIGKK